MAFITQKAPYVDLERDEEGHKDSLQLFQYGVTEMAQSSKNLVKRRELGHVAQDLDEKRQEFKERMTACDEREAVFNKKLQDMKEHTTKFEKFVKDNDLRRARAETKAKSEAKARQAHEDALRKLYEEYKILQAERSDLQTQLDSLRRYEKYLESVVEQSGGEYDEVQEIINRYQTLKSTNTDLLSHIKETETETFAVRGELFRFRNSMQNELLAHDSALQTKQRQLESMRDEHIHSESIRSHQDRIMRDRQSEMGQILTSIQNLQNLCNWKSSSKVKAETIKKLDDEETMAVLHMIQYSIEDLKNIKQTYQELYE